MTHALRALTGRSLPTKAIWAGTILVLALVAGRVGFKSQTAPGRCAADRIDGRGLAEHVYDGDTVRLEDGRKVRLLGINAPEIGRNGERSEPMAEAALAALDRLLPPGTPIDLRHDRERKDRYGRTLAHLFLADGTNVQASLLEQGLATTLVVPPNEWGDECYAALERAARGQGRGVWSLARYQPLETLSGVPDASEFKLVIGTVERVGQSRDAVWLNLSAGVALRIPRADLTYFGDYPPDSLLGRRLIARGWLYERRGQLRMTVRHPAALELLD